MATASPQTITDYFNASTEEALDNEVILSSSVLLTPEKTPTKKSHRTNGDKSPPHSLQSPEEAERAVNKALLSRSQSDSRLESPKPTNAKQTRQEVAAKRNLDEKLEAATKPPAPRGSKARSSRARKPAKSKADTSEWKPADSGKSKSSSKKPARSKSLPKNTLLTDFYPVRRSSRNGLTARDVKKQLQEDLEEKILSGCEDGLEVVQFDGKGRGVVSTKEFKRGDFVVEYIGDLIDPHTAKKRDAKYTDNPEFGCYMYHFNFRNSRYCVDATAESDKLGRLLNHSKLNGNCCTKVVGIDNKPYLILVAARDIAINEELTYDYGDRSKEALEAHPWLAL